MYAYTYVHICIYIYIYFVLILKIDKIDKTEEIHHQFQEFLDEIGKPTSDFELKITNKLFGEKTYLFLQVSFAVSTTSVSGIHE